MADSSNTVRSPLLTATDEQPQPEDYNEPCERRMQMLEELAKQLPDGKVYTEVWATCYSMPLEKLRGKSIAELYQMAAYAIRSLDNWAQKPGYRNKTPSDISLQASVVSSNSVTRNTAGIKRAKERDGYLCVISGFNMVQAAHIFPHCMYSKTKKERKDFERFLSYFYEEECVEKWMAQLNKYVGNTQATTECSNLICLDLRVHSMWAASRFALKPLGVEDPYTMRLQIFLQAPPRFRSEEISLVQPPESTRTVGLSHGEDILRLVSPGISCHIKTGDIIVLHTKDPITHPLPNWELMQLQWSVARFYALAGAAEPREDSMYDSESDVAISKGKVEQFLDDLPSLRTHEQEV